MLPEVNKIYEFSSFFTQFSTLTVASLNSLQILLTSVSFNTNIFSKLFPSLKSKRTLGLTSDIMASTLSLG